MSGATPLPWRVGAKSVFRPSTRGFFFHGKKCPVLEMQQSPLAEEGVGISTVTSQGDVNLDGEP